MANSGDDQELQNETTVRSIALSLSEKAVVVVSAIVFGTTAENTYSDIFDSAMAIRSKLRPFHVILSSGVTR